MAGRSLAPDGHPLLTVSGLLETARSLLDGEIGSVWVEAEVFEYRGPHPGSGHRYFKLRDARSSMNVILWRGTAARALSQEIEDGQKVLARGRFDIYPARGSLSFVIDRIKKSGVGDLAQRFEELKQKLRAEGLFSQDRKRMLPDYPQRVVVITGKDSAAEADMLHVFQQMRLPLQILLRYARVQGEQAKDDLIQALQEAAAVHPDFIVLSRGGGSLEDLWAFNEEDLVRAIAACPVPVLSAVGHEVDFTLSDFVADERAITPTAGARWVLESWEEGLEALHHVGKRLQHVGGQLLPRQKQRFHHQMQRLLSQEPAQRLQRWRLGCQHAEQRLCAAASLLLSARRERLLNLGNNLAFAGPAKSLALQRVTLQKAQARLQAGNPKALLERGYALVSVAENGREAAYLRDPKQVQIGTPLQIQLARGNLRARVE